MSGRPRDSEIVVIQDHQDSIQTKSNSSRVKLRENEPIGIKTMKRAIRWRSLVGGIIRVSDIVHYIVRVSAMYFIMFETPN